jgi:drug/metabolite transporter (DMT)-like permease
MSGSHDSRPKSIELADGVMLLVVVLWASNNVFTKAALDRGLEPLIYVSLRFGLVALLLFPFLKLRGVSLRIHRADMPRFLVSGLCGFAFYNLLYIVGLTYTSAFSAAILIAVAPIFILLLSAIFGIERVLPMQWLGVGISLLGVAVFIGDKLLANEPAIGDILNMLAALCFAIYGLTTRPLVDRYGAQATTAWSVLIGLVAIIPFTARSLWREDWEAVSDVEWFAIAYAAIVSVMLGYSLWGWAIARTGAGRSVPYLFLIPVFTGIFSVIFRGDRLGAAQVAGGTIALAGVAIARVVARPADGADELLPSEETGFAPDPESQPRAVTGP